MNINLLRFYFFKKGYGCCWYDSLLYLKYSRFFVDALTGSGDPWDAQVKSQSWNEAILNNKKSQEDPADAIQGTTLRI